MNIAFSKKSLMLFITILCIFIGAGLVFYFFIYYFPSSVIRDKSILPLTNMNFTDKMYPALLDLGKFFLTIVVGIFVASITFSEKIVNFNSASWWSKSLLILCWILLLISIVCDGVGLVFLTNWYAIELIKHSQENMQAFELTFFCFAFAGISFGLALTSMLSAGIISFINEISFTAKNALPSLPPDL